MLDFIPIVDEDYYFACDRAQLEPEPLASLLELLWGAAFRRSVGHLEGHDPAECGTVAALEDGWGGLQKAL